MIRKDANLSMDGAECVKRGYTEIPPMVWRARGLQSPWDLFSESHGAVRWPDRVSWGNRRGGPGNVMEGEVPREFYSMRDPETLRFPGELTSELTT